MSRVTIDWSELSMQVMLTFGHFLWQACIVAIVLVIVEQLAAIVCTISHGHSGGGVQSHRSFDSGEARLDGWRRSANLRYNAACLAFIALPVCVVTTFLLIHQSRGPILSGGRISSANSDPTESTTIAVAVANAAMPPDSNTNVSVQPSFPMPAKVDFPVTKTMKVASYEAAPFAWREFIQSFAPYAMLSYAIGVGLMLVRFAIAIVGSMRLRQTLEPLDDSNLLKMVVEQSLRLGLKRVPVVAICQRVSVPVVVGIVKPMILLPPALLCGFDPNQLAGLLCHELAHIRRQDLIFNLFQRVIEALLFFHPATWWISRRMSIERENCCDDAAATSTGSLQYASALLRMAELCVQSDPRRLDALATLSASGTNSSQFGQRIRRLVGEPQLERINVSRRTACFALIVTALFVAGGLSATTPMADAQTSSAAIAESSSSDSKTTDAVPNADVVPNADISWTEVPTVALDDPTLQRGIVYGPDGKPLAGANIYAGSTIELFDRRRAGGMLSASLGKIRGVTDVLGRFEFRTPDLTHKEISGEVIRWEIQLVATKEGLPPAWLTTFGADRGFYESWHPFPKKPVAIHFVDAATLRGRFLGPGALPLKDARVRIKGLMVPMKRDLAAHIESQETKELGMFSGINYHETFYRPELLPGVPLETRTDADGNFVFEKLPKDHIVYLEVIHPLTRTIQVRVAVAEMDAVYRKPSFDGAKPELSLRGSGFSYELPKGVSIRGMIRNDAFTYTDNRAAGVSGITVGIANHNESTGMSEPQVKTDAEGKFELTGLYEDGTGDGYTVAIVGSYEVPIVSKRATVRPEHEAIIKVSPAVRYEIKLTDTDGNPVDRKVSSIVVQAVPNTVRHDVKSHFNEAVRVAPGVYRGIVPAGPGAVVVERYIDDRPVLVNPKEFFAPGRTDWTLEEERFAYGDQWQIAQPSVITTPGLSAGVNRSLAQQQLAAVVFTNSDATKGPLDLKATIVIDKPTQFELVDDAGEPVVGASINRGRSIRADKDLPSTFYLRGLHPQRAEFLQFHHRERGLIGNVKATTTSDRIKVVMRPAATIQGSVVAPDGKPTSEFSVRVHGAVPPDTLLGNTVFSDDKSRLGRFELKVAPEVEYSGSFVRRAGQMETRPEVGPAFGPLKPKPGETIHLGSIVSPRP